MQGGCGSEGLLVGVLPLNDCPGSAWRGSSHTVLYECVHGWTRGLSEVLWAWYRKKAPYKCGSFFFSIIQCHYQKLMHRKISWISFILLYFLVLNSNNVKIITSSVIRNIAQFFWYVCRETIQLVEEKQQRLAQFVAVSQEKCISNRAFILILKHNRKLVAGLLFLI